MSSHEAICHKITKIHPHPNADSLGLVHIDGFICVVRLDEINVGDLAIYICPDTVVNSNLPQFLFLNGHERIRVRKFRGVISQGLLIKAPKDAIVGKDYYEELGLQHYEPEEKLSLDGDNEKAPDLAIHKYDIDALLKYTNVFTHGEPVEVSSKIHGSNWRAVHWQGKTQVGSRSTWKKEDPNNIYWKVLYKYPEIEDWLIRNKGKVLWGEVFGPKVQSLTYGLKEIDFRAFDVYDTEMHEFFNKDLAVAVTSRAHIPWVHSYGIMPFDIDAIKDLAEHNDPIAAANGVLQVQEGVVVRPVSERTHPEIGRVILKLVSNRYYLKE